ncbi:UvrD-helicase domain-containing protein [Saccharopolyspora sp. NPDC000995]
MPRLSIAKEFLSDYSKLQKPVQRAVEEALDKFGHHTFAGVHLEKLGGAKDPNIRTIKITNFYRGVVLAPERGEEYFLLTVLPHDDAIAYATSKRFTVNQTLGVLEVRDQSALEDFEPALRAAGTKTDTKLFEHVKDSDLLRLGIDAQLLPLVRLLGSEPHLEALAKVLPDVQYDVLTALASGMTTEETWQELSSRILDIPQEVDVDDFTTAAARTPDKYVTVSGPDELTKIFEAPFALWRVFLHPAQQNVAYRPVYRGPTLVSGGAGTGKTVTAVHRAAYLAEKLPSDGTQKVLLTTFNRGLASSIEEQLRLLVDDELVLARIDVLNVDRLAYRIVTESTGSQPEIIPRAAATLLWHTASRTTDHKFSPTFLQREWEQVILAQDLRNRDAYLQCRRRGRGRPLSRAQKIEIWNAIGSVLVDFRRTGRTTHHQVAEKAAGILAEQEAAPYRHVLVDEGQDLHPAAWRLLRQAVAAGENDLFIVNDPNQRIYENRVSLGSLGINIHNRSYKLKINYRTTQEILSWSVKALDGRPSDGMDDEPDTLAGYRSPMHGKRPDVRDYPDWNAELDGLVTQVQEWLKAGVEADSIGIAARSAAKVKDIKAALDQAGIPHTQRDGAPAARVDTMHSMKGLEFRCAAIVGVDNASLPLPVAITPAEEDPTSHEHDTQRERCLLFVASTRARDALYVSYSGNPSEFLPPRKG